MNYIFCVLQILLFIILILIKKSNNKLNFLKVGIISLTLILCYNIFICYAFSVIGIKSTLLNLSIVNFITSVLLSIRSIKTKEIQRYYVRKSDMIFLILILGVIFTISYFRFGIGFEKLTYRTSDPSVHYMASYEFYENSILSNFNNLLLSTLFNKIEFS